MEGIALVKLLVCFLKTSTKICLDVVSKDNVRSKNSNTLSVGQDIVNCIFLDESMELIKLKNLSKSSLECSNKTNRPTILKF